MKIGIKISRPTIGKILSGIVVSGAGTEVANGFYPLAGVSNGKPDFVKADASAILAWNSLAWVLLDGSGTELYESTEDVANPTLVVTWVAITGDFPLPTVVGA